MQHVILGRTCLRVGVAGPGCGAFGRHGLGSGGTEANAIHVIRTALDLGVNMDQVRSFEVFVAQVSNDDGRQIPFSSMPAEADRQREQLRGLRRFSSLAAASCALGRRQRIARVHFPTTLRDRNVLRASTQSSNLYVAYMYGVNRCSAMAPSIISIWLRAFAFLVSRKCP